MMRALMAAALALTAASLGGCFLFHHHHEHIASHMQRPANWQSVTAACGVAQHQDLIGMSQSAIDESTLPPQHRIICFGCVSTYDYIPDRLDIYIGPGHKVASLHCG